jgi:cell wall-associated NlpC family hydrolase
MALDGFAAIQARIREISGALPPPAAAPARSLQNTRNAEPVDFASVLAGAAESTNGTAAGWSSKAKQFLEIALAQKGKPYVFASVAKTSDADPDTFDCSELTKWAAARVGVTIPDGASAQYVHARESGTLIPVEQALRTPGALLFHFGREPKYMGDRPADGHVAISVGDGVHTIEARGRKYGTNVFELTDSRKKFFNYAAVVPGM